MVDTFYLHLEFAGKKGGWSINLPFLCSRCGVCCTLEDFLTAGEITAEPGGHTEVRTKMKALFDELGKMWEANEAKYDEYTRLTPCPFLIDKSCSIYEIRPGGCRLFPKTAFGMLTQDCPALNRFRKQRASLRKGKKYKENYHFYRKTADSTKWEEPITPAAFTQKQFLGCVAILRRVGLTDGELKLFSEFNKSQKE